MINIFQYKKVSICLIMLIYISGLFGQNLELYTSKKSKTLSEKNYLEIHSSLKENKTNSSNSVVYGKYTSINGNNLLIGANWVSKCEIVNDTNEKRNFTFDLPENTSVPINTIDYIKVFKNEKQAKRKSTYFTIGSVITFTGILTAVNSLLVSKKSKNTLLLSSGIQVGLGTTFLILGGKKKHWFKNSDKELWKIK